MKVHADSEGSSTHATYEVLEKGTLETPPSDLGLEKGWSHASNRQRTAGHPPRWQNATTPPQPPHGLLAVVVIVVIAIVVVVVS